MNYCGHTEQEDSGKPVHDKSWGVLARDHCLSQVNTPVGNCLEKGLNVLYLLCLKFCNFASTKIDDLWPPELHQELIGPSSPPPEASSQGQG